MAWNPMRQAHDPEPVTRPPIAEFLLARIAEDEARIYRADSDGEFRVTWVTFRRRDGSMDYSTVASDHSDGAWVADGTVYADDSRVDVAEPFFDAARVLAECEAKRRIIDRLGPPHFITGGSSAAYAAVLQLLALPYADHPDYQDEWRPDAVG